RLALAALDARDIIALGGIGGIGLEPGSAGLGIGRGRGRDGRFGRLDRFLKPALGLAALSRTAATTPAGPALAGRFGLGRGGRSARGPGGGGHLVALAVRALGRTFAAAPAATPAFAAGLGPVAGAFATVGSPVAIPAGLAAASIAARARGLGGGLGHRGRRRLGHRRPGIGLVGGLAGEPVDDA